MNKKLTLLVDESTIESAKVYAKANGLSLSQIIENYLKLISDDKFRKSRISPKITKLKGKLKLPKDFNYKNIVADSISDKYIK